LHARPVSCGWERNARPFLRIMSKLYNVAIAGAGIQTQNCDKDDWHCRFVHYNRSRMYLE
jgi:hypothetical protein